MPTGKRHIKSVAYKGLLLAGYLFLFTSQFNYHYFGLANFFVYANNVRSVQQSGGAVIIKTMAEQKAVLQHAAAFHSHTQRPAHLGIDKRYRFKEGIRIPEIRGPAPVYVIAVKVRFYTPLPLYSTADLPTNSLRGPPCA